VLTPLRLRQAFAMSASSAAVLSEALHAQADGRATEVRSFMRARPPLRPAPSCAAGLTPNRRRGMAISRLANHRLDPFATSGLISGHDPVRSAQSRWGLQSSPLCTTARSRRC
jgi:hypothetical protein